MYVCVGNMHVTVDARRGQMFWIFLEVQLVVLQYMVYVPGANQFLHPLQD